MALEFATGTIDWLPAHGVGTDYTVSGLSFQPKAIRIHFIGTDGQTAQTISARRCVGFASSTSNRMCVATNDVDGSGSMDCGSGFFDDCIAAMLTSSTVEGKLDLESITSDGFVLTVTDQSPASSNMRLFWEAWGGDDITVAEVIAIAEPAATGSVNYTVNGFVSFAVDQVVMFAGVQSVSAAGTAENQDSGLCIGFAAAVNPVSPSSMNIVVVGNNDDGSASADTDGYCKTGQCLAMITVAGGNPNAEAQLSQFNTNGFTLSWTSRALTNRRYIALAIKGGQWRSGSLTIDNSSVGNTATVSGLPFAPKGILLMGRNTTESTAGTATAQDRIALGHGISTTSRRSHSMFSEDATSSAEINVAFSSVAVLAFPSATGTVDALIDIDAMNSDGFQLIVDDAPATTSATEWIGYLTFGNASAGAGQPKMRRFSETKYNRPVEVGRSGVKVA